MHDELPATILITPFAPEHAAGVLEVVRTVYHEYGFTWDDSPYFDDLHDVPGHYAGRGGMFWVLRDGPRVIGTVGVTPHSRGESELHRLYLLPEHRGRQWGRRLLETAMQWSRAQGFPRMIAWSDVKLPHAHAMYRASGFVQRGERTCNDPDKAREYGFVKEPL